MDGSNSALQSTDLSLHMRYVLLRPGCVDFIARFFQLVFECLNAAFSVEEQCRYLEFLRYYLRQLRSQSFSDGGGLPVVQMGDQWHIHR